jgi:hypothetical protein
MLEWFFIAFIYWYWIKIKIKILYYQLNIFFSWKAPYGRTLLKTYYFNDHCVYHRIGEKIKIPHVCHNFILLRTAKWIS